MPKSWIDNNNTRRRGGNNLIIPAKIIFSKLLAFFKNVVKLERTLSCIGETKPGSGAFFWVKKGLILYNSLSFSLQWQRGSWVLMLLNDWAEYFLGLFPYNGSQGLGKFIKKCYCYVCVCRRWSSLIKLVTISMYYVICMWRIFLAGKNLLKVFSIAWLL